MKKTIYLFTTNFPYGNSETFLETELPFLAEQCNVVIIPLFISGKKRNIPSCVRVADPLLSFSPKQKKELISNGLFNCSPLFFAVPEFFNRKVFCKKIRIWNYFTSLLLIRSMLKNFKLKFDEGSTIYFYWSDKSALLAPFIKKKNRCKIIARFHGTDLYEEAKGGYIPFRKILFKSIDMACPISENGKKYLMENYKNFALPKIVVSRLGVLERGKNPTNTTHIFQLVSCSNVIPIKRVILIAQALQYIDFQLKWTHIGGGNLFEELKNEVKKMPKNIEVDLKGILPNAHVINLYRNQPFDLFINVSASEGIPVSIMEAMSFGIPALATDVGGVSELVNEDNGRLIASEITPQQLANEIKDFLMNVALQQKRENARNFWNLNFNGKKNYNEFIKLALS